MLILATIFVSFLCPLFYGSVAAAQLTSPAIAYPSYGDLLNFQAEQHKNTLAAQAKIAEEAIQVAMRSQQSVQVFVAVAGFLLAFFTALFGWILKRGLQQFERLNKRSEAVAMAVEVKSVEMEQSRVGFQEQLTALAQKIQPLQTEVREYTEALDRIHETIRTIEKGEQMEDRIEQLMIKARLAELRIDILSGADDDKFRAAQAASETVRLDRGFLAVRLLLDCLRHRDIPFIVQAEALYGLGSRGRELIEDRDAINLIIAASRSPDNAVRLQAVHTMGKIGASDVAIQTRLRECVHSDVYSEVRDSARRVLKEQGLE